MINENYAKIYCREDITLIENYKRAAVDVELWDCHHRNEITMNKSRHELKQLGLYYKRPASELIFIPRIEHIKLHNTGKHHSSETREKMSKSKKGRVLSDETRAKMSNAAKARYNSLEEREKASKRQKGKSQPKYRWINSDGDIIIMCKNTAAQWHKDYKLLSNIPVDPNEKVPLTR